MTGDRPPERDLRDHAREHPPADTRPATPPPANAPEHSYPEPPATGHRKPPAYSEVVEESGLTGIRIVAKLIDIVAIIAIFQILLIPASIVPGLVPGSDVDQEELEQRMDAAETSGEVIDIFMEVMAPYLVFSTIAINILTLVYFFVGEYMTKQSLGKKAFGLRTVDRSGVRMTAKQSLTRAVMTTVSIMFWLWIIDILIMLTRADGKSVIDLAAGTQVVRVKKVFHYPGQ